MTEDILSLMDQRRKAKGNRQEYERINSEVRKRCDEAKEKWLDDKCKEIDILQKQAPNTIYRNVEEVVGHKKSCNTGCIRAKNGDIFMEKRKNSREMV